MLEPRPFSTGSVAARIGVIFNPGSGANLKSPDAMRRVLDAHPDIPYCNVSDPDSVARALDELAAHDVNIVAISGGDGTVHAVISTLLNRNPFPQLPLLAILHSGTTNMTAGDIGYRGRPHRALKCLIRRATGDAEGLHILRRHIICVNPGAGRAPLYGMFFGAAAICQGIEYCRGKVHRVGLRGEIGPGVAMLRFALAMARGERDIVSPVTVGVSMDGSPVLTSECEIFHVTTLKRLFLGLRPFWGKEDAPLHFSCVRAHPRHWVRALPGLLRGKINRFMTPENGYISHNVRRLELRFDGDFTVDGEIFATAPDTPLVLTDGGTLDFVRLT